MDRIVDFDAEECPQCGETTFTVDADDPELLTDGDSVTCKCGARGFVACDSETSPYIIWKD